MLYVCSPVVGRSCNTPEARQAGQAGQAGCCTQGLTADSCLKPVPHVQPASTISNSAICPHGAGLTGSVILTINSDYFLKQH
jgi:hypothetical protein